MGLFDELEMDRENDRADVRGASLEARAHDFLESMRDEIDGGDSLDELVDILIDDTSELRAFVKQALSGEERGRYAEQVRTHATHLAYAKARES